LISVAYVIFLGGIGSLMVVESVRETLRRRRGMPPASRRRPRSWIDLLPFKMRFRKSRQYISVLLPLSVGGVVGILAAIMGVGGGFIMVPAMIYLLNMPTNVVIGTSLFQITIVTACVAFLHSVNTQTVDVVLALLLLIGAVIGAQIGARMGVRLKGEQLRGLLGLIVLLVCTKLAYDLVVRPSELYSVVPLGS
ncbi:MAG: sulfite exporter TauE/SafE family protein, partial [Alphaproteobacteria bacterium]